MVRKIVALTIVVGALALVPPAHAVPSPASGADAGQRFAHSSQGVCVCVVTFIGYYEADSYGVHRLTHRELKRRGVRRPWRRRVNRGIYDYERGGYGSKPNWCKRNVRACRAV